MFDSVAHRGTRSSLFRAKSLQFIYFFAAGAAFPFFPVYYYTILRDSSGKAMTGLIGSIMALQSLTGIFAPPLAGLVSDRFRIHRQMLSVCAFISALTAFAMTLPGFSVASGVSPVLIILLFSSAALHGLTTKPLMPLIDTECLNDLRALKGDTSSYGSIRMFGSAGWTLSVILGGALLYLVRLPNSALLVYAMGFTVLGLFTVRGTKAEVKKVSIPWRTLIRDKRYFRFLFFVFVSAVAVAGSYAYTSIYMQEQQLNTFLIGFALGISALAEVPLFLIAPKILRLVGDKWMIIAGSLLQMVKLLLFSRMNAHSPFLLFLSVQLVHGIGYSIFFAGVIHFIDARSHHNLKATYQSLYHMMWAAGSAFAGFIIPFIIEARGSACMMGVFALIMAFGTAFAALVFRNSKAEISR
ncbi:MAG: MFS transporter [Spirochaetales bacterium]|nr:MFS transporter [Spirochaetales bacterium]